MKNIFDLKNLKNYRWKVRYSNLEKKYNELLEENEKLKEKSNEEHLTRLLRNKNAMIKKQKQIIKNLKEDYKKLNEEKKGE